MLTLLSKDMQKGSTLSWVTKRHFLSIFKHITLRKFFNSLVLLFEMQFQRAHLYSKPVFLRIEVSPLCNLRCPGCLLHLACPAESSPDHRKYGMMPYDSFKENVKDLLPYLFKVNLYDEGEPLLNPEIHKIIKLLSDNNVTSCISSNFSMKLSDERLAQIVDSGLEHLIVAVDGATQETYSSYRQGGDLNTVISNIRRILALKKKMKSHLKLELQFIDFEKNEAERSGVQKLAEDIGAWRFTAITGTSRHGWAGARFKGSEAERRRRGCYELWLSSTINSKGELGTCDYGEDNGIPNIGLAKEYLLKDLRNHPDLVKLRNSFRDASVPLNEMCRHCSLYKKRSHRED